jgi:hypothetical protein
MIYLISSRFETCQIQHGPALCLSVLSSLTAINGVNLRYRSNRDSDPILSVVLRCVLIFEVTFLACGINLVNKIVINLHFKTKRKEM